MASEIDMKHMPADGKLKITPQLPASISLPSSAMKCTHEPAYLTWSPPAFSQINPGAHAYSAFCHGSPGVTKEDCGSVVAIAVASAASVEGLACKLW